MIVYCKAPEHPNADAIVIAIVIEINSKDFSAAKYKIFASLGRRFRDKHWEIDAIFFVSEAWMRKPIIENGEMTPGEITGEMIAVMGSTPDGRQNGACIKITRENKNPCGEMTVDVDGTNLTFYTTKAGRRSLTSDLMKTLWEAYEGISSSEDVGYNLDGLLQQVPICTPEKFPLLTNTSKEFFDTILETSVKTIHRSIMAEKPKEFTTPSIAVMGIRAMEDGTFQEGTLSIPCPISSPILSSYTSSPQLLKEFIHRMSESLLHRQVFPRFIFMQKLGKYKNKKGLFLYGYAPSENRSNMAFIPLTKALTGEFQPIADDIIVWKAGHAPRMGVFKALREEYDIYVKGLAGKAADLMKKIVTRMGKKDTKNETDQASNN
jgi:hypothetical protein